MPNTAATSAFTVAGAEVEIHAIANAKLAIAVGLRNELRKCDIFKSTECKGANLQRHVVLVAEVQLRAIVRVITSVAVAHKRQESILRPISDVKPIADLSHANALQRVTSYQRPHLRLYRMRIASLAFIVQTVSAAETSKSTIAHSLSRRGRWFCTSRKHARNASNPIEH